LNLKKVNSLLRWWGPWVFWCLLIFYLSSLHHTPDFLRFKNFDKIAHAYAYLILGFLTLRAFEHWSEDSFHRFYIAWAFLFCVLYGASDEWHQLFVAGRTCDVKDWLADTAGASLALGIYWI